MPWTPPPELLDHIRHFEGYRDFAYQDTGGVWTIGYGATRMPDGDPVQPGDTITQEQAEELLARQLQVYHLSVTDAVKVPLSELQDAALTDFCYNVGGAQFNSSTLLKRLNRGDYTAPITELPRWAYDNGQWLDGLYRRRMATIVMWCQGTTAEQARSYAG